MWGGQTFFKRSMPLAPFSARAATRGGKGLRNIRLSRVARPVRALFLEKRLDWLESQSAGRLACPTRLHCG
jgi:hypothetical protein